MPINFLCPIGYTFSKIIAEYASLVFSPIIVSVSIYRWVSFTCTYQFSVYVDVNVPFNGILISNLAHLTTNEAMT